MAAAVMRNMNHGQNLHLLPNNCVIVSQTGTTPSPPVHMHHHQNSLVYTTHHYQQQQQQQQQQQHSHQISQNQIQQQPQISTQMHHHNQQQQPLQTHQLGKRPIAPAPAEHNRSSVISNIDQNRLGTSSNSKKPTKMTYTSHMPYGATQPASVQRRNARERNRVKQVNNGFAKLRQHIPSDIITTLTNGGRGASKKLSKVDTLRIAVQYIRSLQITLDDNDTDSTSTTSSSHLSQTSSNSGGSYYSPSPIQCNSVPPPACSESSASPTPSYTSDNSSIGTLSSHFAPVPPYKCEIFDAYNPEDEDLLDCIAWWQQQPPREIQSTGF